MQRQSFQEDIIGKVFRHQEFVFLPFIHRSGQLVHGKERPEFLGSVMNLSLHGLVVAKGSELWWLTLEKGLTLPQHLLQEGAESKQEG